MFSSFKFCFIFCIITFLIWLTFTAKLFKDTIAVFSQVAILTCVNIPNMIQLLIYLSILQVDNKLEDVSLFV